MANLFVTNLGTHVQDTKTHAQVYGTFRTRFRAPVVHTLHTSFRRYLVGMGHYKLNLAQEISGLSANLQAILNSIYLYNTFTGGIARVLHFN